MKRHAAAVGLVFVVLCSLAATAVTAGKPKKPPGGDAGPSYNIFRLSETAGEDAYVEGFPRSINNSSQIVGQVRDPITGEYFAAHWDITESGGSWQSTLRILPSNSEAVAYAINEENEIVGTGFNGGLDCGLYWADHSSAPVALSPLTGDDGSEATCINDVGAIGGVSWKQLYDEFGEPAGRALTAVAWKINVDATTGNPAAWGPIALPTLDQSFANGINDNNNEGLAEIVGGFPFDATTPYTAVVWTVQTHADGTLSVNPIPEILDDNAVANAANNSSEVCGWWGAEAVVWRATPQILDRNRYVPYAKANNISNNGAIVGWAFYERRRERGNRAVLWPGAGSSMILLDQFLGRNSPFTHLTNALDVNGGGRVVGSGWDGAFDGPFLAIPE